VELHLSTDVKCEDHPATSIAVSRSSTAAAEPATITNTCQPDGTIGTLVILPASSKDETLQVQVVTSFGGPVETTCVAPNYGPTCIVSRRHLAFVPHEELVLPIFQEVDCGGIVCGESQTCRGGGCVSALVDVDHCKDSPDECGIELISPPNTGGAGGQAGSGGRGGQGGVAGQGGAGQAGSGGAAGMAGQGGAGGSGGAAGQGGMGGAGQGGAGMSGAGQGGAGMGGAGAAGKGGAGMGGAGAAGKSGAGMGGAGMGGAGMSGAGQGGAGMGGAGMGGAGMGGAGMGGAGMGGAGAGGDAGMAGAGMAGSGGMASPPLQAATVTVGENNTCVTLTDGRVKCWGGNAQGQLGLEDTKDRGKTPGTMGNALPFVALGPEGVSQVVTFNGSGCGRAWDGDLRCWGNNFDGQLGQGDTATRGDKPGTMGSALGPIDLGSVTTAKRAAIGSTSTCALVDASGTAQVKCWGAGILGLGDMSTHGDKPGTMSDSLLALALGTGQTPTAITAGYDHNCVLLASDQVKCWGRNTKGQLGLGDAKDRGNQANQMGDSLPAVDLGTGQKAIGVVAGFYFSCALLGSGQIKCWGQNDSGQLGQGDTAPRGAMTNQMGDKLAAIDLGAGAKASSLCAGSGFACAIVALQGATRIKCWGQNDSGQLGLGDTMSRGDGAGEMGDLLPSVDTAASSPPTALACGLGHVCAVFASGAVKCWGRNDSGQLGLGDNVSRGGLPGQMGKNLPFVDLGTGP
jgi:alpha-tubulin suppressor-like RCC1 family protein